MSLSSHVSTKTERPQVDLNVVLVGAAGVGKSSIINLLAQNDIAPKSSAADGCTEICGAYDLDLAPADDTSRAIDATRFVRLWDTPGLTPVVPKPHGHHFQPLLDLQPEPVDLILFCIRSGIRDLAPVRVNWEIVRGLIFGTDVPVLIVVTGLETEEPDMESWWKENESDFEENGIKLSDDCRVVCITAVNSDRHKARCEESRKALYNAITATTARQGADPRSVDKSVSQRRIKKYLKDYHKGGFEAARAVLREDKPLFIRLVDLCF